MTKAELIKALENIGENEEVLLVNNTTDRDDVEIEYYTEIKAVIGGEIVKAKYKAEDEKLITRLEKDLVELKAEYEKIPARFNRKRAEAKEYIEFIESNLKNAKAKA